MPPDGAGHELNELPFHSAKLEEDQAGNMSRDYERNTDEAISERNPLAGSYAANSQDIDRLLDQQTVQKLDRILLPFLALLFLLNSLDKANIGNAETAGFTHDTGLSPLDVNISMAVFFFVFVLLQPVGAALGRYFGMRRYVPTCMTLWGLSTVLHIFVRKRWQLVLLRMAIAMLESGFYPTTVSYLSLFYTKYQFAWRLGVFYGMSAVSGVLGGVLSWAVFSRFPGGPDPAEGEDKAMRDDVSAGGWKSWEVLFLIEGCTTMTVALIGYFWLPRSAHQAWFLTPRERMWAERRMQLDQSSTTVPPSRTPGSSTVATTHASDAHGPGHRADEGADEAYQRLLDNVPEHEIYGGDSDEGPAPVTADTGLTRSDVLSAVLSYNIWHLLLVNVLSAIPATSFGVLLPILIKQLSPSLSLSPAASNLLAAPPFALGAVVLFAFTAWSDRSRQRLIPIAWGLALLIVGLSIAVFSPMGDYWLRYCALCILLSGSYIASPLTVAWLANNTPEPGKRAIMLGMNGWGNLAGVFMAGLFTPEDKENGYHRSFVILLICSLASLAGFLAFRVHITLVNRWRDEIIAGWDAQAVAREEKFGDAPVPETLGAGFLRRSGLWALAVRFGLEEERRGDDKIMFRYGF